MFFLSINKSDVREIEKKRNDIMWYTQIIKRKVHINTPAREKHHHIEPDTHTHSRKRKKK
jgi:hypothetical protein